MFLTLDEYLLGARKILSLYGFHCHRNDEDAISYVAHRMMLADQTWDGHSSSKNTWRFNQARYAIMKLKTKHKKQRKLFSLNKTIGKSGSKDIYLSDIIPDKTKENTIEMFKQVMTYAQNLLSPRQYDCLRLHYQENLTMEKIGKMLGITKQAVSLSIIKGIQIIKNECESQFDNITS